MPPPLSGPPLLLASVVDAAEAALALRHGADILDVKNPREGALGAQPPSVLRAVVEMRDRGRSRSVAVSAALGDAPNLPGTFALAAAGAAACGVDYVKVGLRGLRSEEESADFLSAVVAGALSAATGRVRVIAAAYADAWTIGSLAPFALPRLAQRASAHGCLIDTAVKDGRDLFDHLDGGAIAAFIADCRRRGLLCGLAGSLRPEHIPRLLDLAPDVVGARGALCTGGREGRLEASRLRAFRAALHGATAGRDEPVRRRPAGRRPPDASRA